MLISVVTVSLPAMILFLTLYVPRFGSATDRPTGDATSSAS